MTNVFQAPEGPKTLKAGAVAMSATRSVDGELLVDFNRIVQESFESVKKRLDQLNAIIRCDNLPHVQADAKDMRQLSDNMIYLILQHPPQKSKLFIYIKCNLSDNDLQPDNILNRLQTYEICVHTNSCNEASWQTAHVPELKQCAVICDQYSGTFVSAYGHADCLFRLTLLGKLF